MIILQYVIQKCPCPGCYMDSIIVKGNSVFHTPAFLHKRLSYNLASISDLFKNKRDCVNLYLVNATNCTT